MIHASYSSAPTVVAPTPTVVDSRPPASALQPRCTLPAERRETLPAVDLEVRSGTPQEERVARQKAGFVADVLTLSTRDHVKQSDACAIVALRTDAYPDLLTAGKRGRSLLEAEKAYHNYRSWKRSLGKTADGQLALGNWRALLPKYRNSRGYRRPGPSDFWTVLARIYEHPNKLSLRYAHKLAALEFRRVAGGGAEVPTIDQAAWYYSNHVDRKQVLIAREGEDWFRNRVAGHIDRDAPDPDEVWVGDHHVFDAGVRIWDKERCDWRAVRPWLTAWLDWGSLYFVGFQIRVLSPSRDPIERSLKRAVVRNQYRPPTHLYIDNGKDYKAKGFTRPCREADEERVSSICEALGCQPHFALPYNARAKIIERRFRDVCGWFSKLWPSYRGSSPETRPERAHEVWARPDQLPTLDEFAAAFERWLGALFHHEPSKGKVLQGRTPAEVRAAMHQARPPILPETAYKAFLRELPQPRKIRKGGCVRIYNRDYRSDALWQIQCNDEVRVKLDPDDVSTVWIYTLDGREIGAATCKPSLPGMIDPRDKQSIEQLRAEERRTRRQIRAVKTGSAERRALGAYRHSPAIPTQLAPATTPALPSVPSVVAPSADAAQDVTELDQVLAAYSRDRLAATDDSHDYDPEDAAFLASLEREIHEEEYAHA